MMDVRKGSFSRVRRSAASERWGITDLSSVRSLEWMLGFAVRWYVAFLST